MITLTFPEQDNLFKSIITIGADFLVKQNEYQVLDKKSCGIIRRYRNRRKINSEEDDTDENGNLLNKADGFIFLLPEKKSELIFKDKKLFVTVSRQDIPINILENMRFKTNVTLETEGDMDFVKEFLDYCSKEYEKRFLGKIDIKGTITHWIWDDNYWDDISQRKKRKLESISLNETGYELFEEMKTFLSSETEELYEKLGVNYKMNYLFEGVPGTGKTSLIFALASELELDIAIIHFDSKLTDVQFMKAIQRLPKKCVLVIEDVDHLFIERKKNDEYKNSITFSGILNVLDGFGSQHRQITFITTNHECVLDPAFKRPGRIDKKVHFDYSTKNQIEHMYNRFIPEQASNFKEFYKKVKHCKITTAVLQNFLFQWRTCDNIIEHVDSLIESANKNVYNKNGSNMFS